MCAASLTDAGTESRHFLTSITTETRHQHAVAADSPVRDAGDCRSEGRQRHAAPAEAELVGQKLLRQSSAFGADPKRSLFQLVTTAALFGALLAAMGAASHDSYWLTLVLAIPAGGLLVRLFVIQHDCGHRSFFKSRAANDALGRALSMLTWTPYGSWRRGHAAHHASTGNLDRRGRGDVDTLTVAEYEALSPLRQLAYRLYRNPLILVVLGAPVYFILLQRVPRGQDLRDRDARRSILSLNVALALVYGLLMAAFGVVPVIATYLPVMIIASWAASWLFHVQHQFEDPYWERDGAWNFHTAALRGSSHFALPPVLQWFSGNIGLHHVHHLCSRIPNYRLQAFHDSAPELQGVARQITLRESLDCWRLALWDEQSRLLVRFRDLKPRSA